MPQPQNIPPYSADYHLYSSSVVLPTPAPGLQNSSDTVLNIFMPLADNALSLPGLAEHNPRAADNSADFETETTNASESLAKKWAGAKGEKVGWIFATYQ
jgi:hypothetical protein